MKDRTSIILNKVIRRREAWTFWCFYTRVSIEAYESTEGLSTQYLEVIIFRTIRKDIGLYNKSKRKSQKEKARIKINMAVRRLVARRVWINFHRFMPLYDQEIIRPTCQLEWVVHNRLRVLYENKRIKSETQQDR
jgi:hypothetical protein